MAPGQTQLVNALLRDDAKQFFVIHCEEIFENWISLLRQTTLPDDASCSDESVTNALVALHRRVTQAETPPKRFLASVQLARTLDILKRRIRTQRRNGTTVGRPGHGDATAIIDIYMKATGAPKEQVHDLIRVANRCTALGKDVPLLLLVLTDEVGKVM